jgi:hypothetical protein
MDQIALAARLVTQNRVEMLNMVVGPLVGASGKDYKPGRAKYKAPPKKGLTAEQKQIQDIAKLQVLQSMGFSVDGGAEVPQDTGLRPGVTIPGS